MKRTLILSTLIFTIGLILAGCDTFGGTSGAPVAIPPLPTKPNSQENQQKMTPGSQTQPTTIIQTAPAGGVFWSDGDYISGWYWLRDAAYQRSANWIVNIPAGSGDLVLNIEVVATDKASGKRGVDAQFYLVFGTPPASPGQDGTRIGRKSISIRNTSTADDPVGYTCKGTVTFTRAELNNASRVWLKAARADVLGDGAPAGMHTAFNSASLNFTAASGPTLLIADDYWSDGSLISGWNWVRDTTYKSSANWLFRTLPPGSGDLQLQLEVLATGGAGGGRGMDASFFLYYGSSPTGNRLGTFTGSLLVKLRNSSPPEDPVGYTNKGTISIPRAALKGAENLLLKATRKDDSGSQPNIAVHVAFNQDAIKILK